jgi:hypothetical protein
MTLREFIKAAEKLDNEALGQPMRVSLSYTDKNGSYLTTYSPTVINFSVYTEDMLIGPHGVTTLRESSNRDPNKAPKMSEIYLPKYQVLLEVPEMGVPEESHPSSDDDYNEDQ